MEEKDIKWSAVLSYIRERVNVPTYKGWFENTALSEIRGNKLIIHTPNNLTTKKISEEHVDILREAIKEVFGKDYEFEVLTNGELNKLPDIPEEYIEKRKNIELNPKYTFSTFVIGPSNKLAHAASLAVAKNPAKAYNPLFIYGGVGLGKTHLMHAIGHYVLNQDSTKRIMYTTSEKFTNALINAIRDDKTEEFRRKYRNVDILLIDDIQFLAGKERTQEEFFHTFNALHDSNHQIVITSDRPPQNIPTLEDRLISRFEWGLITDISPPDLETRIAILRKKMEIENFYIEDEIIEFIATNISSNIRELEGALNKLKAHMELTGEKITLENAEEILKSIIKKPKRKKNIGFNEIIDASCKYFQVTKQDIISKKRNKEIVIARQVSMYLARELTNLSLLRIGELFGGRDHTTVIHAYEKIKKDKEIDPIIKNAVNNIMDIIKNPGR